MFVTRRGAAGFTLVEMMITISVMALLVMAAAPAFLTWTANAKVRSVAESLANDLRQAQTEAITRNRQTVLALTAAAPALTAQPAADGRHWFSRALPLVASETVDVDDFIHGSTVAASNNVGVTGQALMCFNSIGRPVANTATGLGADCAAPTSAVTPLRYVVSQTNADRRYTVEVYLGGQVRLCDGAKVLSDDHPDGCAA